MINGLINDAPRHVVSRRVALTLLTPMSFDRWRHSKTFSPVNQMKPTVCLLNLLNNFLHRCKLANESLGWLSCHLLSATLLNTIRLEIAVNYFANCSLAECCFSRYLPSCSVSLWHVFLTQHKVTNDILMLWGARTERGWLPLSRASFMNRA